MRHRKATFKVGRNSSHRRCMIANMLKSLIAHGKIETTVTKAKELRKHADRLVTLAKKNTLASRRQVISALMISYNPLSTKEKKEQKEKSSTLHSNADRIVVGKLFSDLGPRFAERQGGYTRITRTGFAVGDASARCVIEYLL